MNSQAEPILVLVTVNKHETQSVLDAFLGPHIPPQQRSIEGITYNLLGSHGGSFVVHTVCEMGAGGLGASQHRTAQAITHWKPVAVIAVGVAFGMDETKQKIGDVLVSRQLQDYELARLSNDGTLIPRGDKAAASDNLRNRFRQIDATQTRQSTDWPRVNIGLILSGQKLVDNLDYRQSLKQLFQEAIGGEMEGVGLYVSASAAKVDWIVVKGICDWGYEKSNVNKDVWQKQAAEAAARVMKAALDAGPLYDSMLPASQDLFDTKSINESEDSSLWPPNTSADFLFHTRQLHIAGPLLRHFRSVMLHPDFPCWMSRGGMMVRNPVWNTIPAAKRRKLIAIHHLDGPSPPDVMYLDLILYRRNCEGGRGELYTYFSKDWKCPLIHFRQRLPSDSENAKQLNTKKVSQYWRVPSESVSVSPLGDLFTISVKQNPRTENLTVYVFTFWSAIISQDSEYIKNAISLPTESRGPWIGLRALRMDPVSWKVNGDVLDSILSMFSVGLGPIPVSFPWLEEYLGKPNS